MPYVATATVRGLRIRLYRDTLPNGTSYLVGYNQYGVPHGIWRIHGMDEETTIVRPAIEKVDDVLYADGWDDCLIGHGTIFHGSDGQKVVAIYDRNKMVQRLAREMLEQHEEFGARSGEINDEEQFLAEADEYISFNVEGAFIQPGMPVFAVIEKECECG